ncbi:MAG: nucleotide sugar dehydrogenase [Acidobacteriota bacterium]|nr:nucleotide sugar dehydrogenase [Acidobacteriota bacterium]
MRGPAVRPTGRLSGEKSSSGTGAAPGLTPPGRAVAVASVVVMGQGYVGLPLAVRAAEAGHHVIGFDVDGERARRLAAGESFVGDVTSQRLRAALGTGRYRPTASAAELPGFDVGIIAVPTPLKAGAPDLADVAAAARTLGERLRPGACVVLESTTYPGTTEEVVGPILEQVSGLRVGRDFHLGYSPERIDPGNAAWDIATTPKPVSGVDAASLQSVQCFYDTIVDQTVAVSGTREAELAKLIENTFRAVNVALVNEIATFARDLDVDIWESIEVAATKPFGFMRFDPGPGVGGHCLPVDAGYLSWRVRERSGRPLRLVDTANDINGRMPGYVVGRLTAALHERGIEVEGSRILLLGLAYKEESGDTRESPAVAVAEALVALRADVSAADPHVDGGVEVAGVRRVELGPEEISDVDAVVLLTAHRAFDLDLVASRASLVFDARGRLRGPNIERL